MATVYSNIKAGLTTDNPLTSGATTINSAAFANLPAVSGSDILWLTLDPDAVNGAPEIVKVTAHTASATSVTVTRAQQSTSARSHPVNTTWKHAVTKTDLDEFLKTVAVADLESDVTNRLPQAGDIKLTIATAEAGGWINHNQAVANCDSTYPALWAVAPASWKSGTTLTIPNLADVGFIGAGTVAVLGAAAGSNTVTLTTTELPAHTHTGPSHVHTINHGHANTLAAPAHTHSVDPPSTTTSSDTHSHTYADTISSGGDVVLGAGVQYWADTTSNTGNDTHSHTVDIASFTSGGASSTTLTGAVTDHAGDSGSAGTGDTGSTGSGSPFSVTGRVLGVNVQILAY